MDQFEKIRKITVVAEKVPHLNKDNSSLNKCPKENGLSGGNISYIVYLFCCRCTRRKRAREE